MKHKGFTLIEVLVSMAILATAIVAVVLIFPIGARNVLFSTNQSTMAEEARTQFDRIRALGVQNLPENIHDLNEGEADNLYPQDLKESLREEYKLTHEGKELDPLDRKAWLDTIRKLLMELNTSTELYRQASLFQVSQAGAVYGMFFNADKEYYRITCEFQHRNGDEEEFVTFLSRR